MSHLSTLVSRFEVAVDSLELSREMKDREKRVKQELMNIIEYMFNFRSQIDTKEIHAILNELDLGKREVKDYDKD
jgi:hypothetical protein